jgi:preprotein translocase subunit SecF
MRKILRFSGFFLPAAVISIVLAVTGITGFFIKGGFNLGVDFPGRSYSGSAARSNRIQCDMDRDGKRNPFA